MTYPGFRANQAAQAASAQASQATQRAANDAARRATTEGMRSASNFRRSPVSRSPSGAAGKVVGIVLILIVLALTGVIFAMVFTSASAQLR